jgi:autotransporter-associated beta strand protein
VNLKSDLSSSFYVVSAATSPSASATINLGSNTPGVAAGIFRFNAFFAYSGSSLTLNGSATLKQQVYLQYDSSATGPWFVHNTANLILSSPITQSGQPVGTNIDVVKDQPGTMTFSGLGNSDFGNLTVNNGMVVLNESSGVAIPHALSVANGAAVQWTLPNQLAATSAVTLNGATGNSLLNLNGYNDTISSLSFIAGGTMNTGSGVATLGGTVAYTGASAQAVINGNLNLGTTTPTFNISSSSATPALRINANISGGSGIGINKTGNGMLLLAGANSFTGPITVSSGSVQFTTTGQQALALPAIALAGTTDGWQGKMDLQDGKYTIATTSLATLTNQIKQGFSSGRWNGNGGIVSSTAANDSTHLTALGAIQNNQSGTALYNSAHPFYGTVPDIAAILIKYTYYGDTNLDGTVNGTDYSRIDAAYLADRTNPIAVTGWFNGDFNYDGLVNGSDYTLIDNAFNRQGANISAQLANPSATITDQIAGTSSVPEPANASGVLAIAAAMLLRWRYHSCNG